MSYAFLKSLLKHIIQKSRLIVTLLFKRIKERQPFPFECSMAFFLFRSTRFQHIV